MIATEFPELEYHFTLNETLNTLLHTLSRHTRGYTTPEGRLERRLVGTGWHWIISRPAMDDLMSGPFAGVVDVEAEGMAVTLWGYPVTIYQSACAVVYFGQGVV
jgi:hypothetical protein